MKKNRIIYKLLCCLVCAVLITACDDDDETAGAQVDFAGISSTYHESDGTTTVTLPIRGSANASDLDFEFDGTATEGEDFEFIGLTAEGVQISLIDDNDLEPAEKLRIRMVSPNLNLNGNAIHTISLVSNCEDTENSSYDSYFSGNYAATEKYGPTEDDWYGPYEITLVQDETDPAIFHFDNLYDNGCEAYMVFDLAAGTVYFPDQEPCGVPLTNSSGTFVLGCNTELTINLNFDGGDWVYSFTKL